MMTQRKFKKIVKYKNDNDLTLLIVGSISWIIGNIGAIFFLFFDKDISLNFSKLLFISSIVLLLISGVELISRALENREVYWLEK